MMTQIVSPTRNREWGFWGTIAMYGHDPATAWDYASLAIAKAINSERPNSAEGIRAFLDSRAGRHFADTVDTFMQDGITLDEAIDKAISEWQRRRTSRRLHQEEGIPAGLPYLTGWVYHYIVLTQST